MSPKRYVELRSKLVVQAAMTAQEALQRVTGGKFHNLGVALKAGRRALPGHIATAVRDLQRLRNQAVRCWGALRACNVTPGQTATLPETNFDSAALTV